MTPECAQSIGCSRGMLLLHDDNSEGKLAKISLKSSNDRTWNALSGFFFRTRKTVSKSSRYLVR